jgi:hypothetical protein
MASLLSTAATGPTQVVQEGSPALRPGCVPAAEECQAIPGGPDPYYYIASDKYIFVMTVMPRLM